MTVTEINSHVFLFVPFAFEEFRNVTSKNTPTVFDFWASGCGRCKAVAPIFEEASNGVNGAEFYKLNVDMVPDAAQEVGVYAMPTFMVFKDGAKLNEVVGANSAKLHQLVEQAPSL
ncbi:hypothetical protein FE257_009107 [Aspergillus nanangensis]|uniref:Thioredoxin domain-containing protein n=1 Tax=Aspergillus nanangensis TaxID=2582783 RepID=A0AAD4GXS4_ASPNN|nr:hypothetical protein FE257_009107 [Aspergillus nanangensis]